MQRAPRLRYLPDRVFSQCRTSSRDFVRALVGQGVSHGRPTLDPATGGEEGSEGCEGFVDGLFEANGDEGHVEVHRVGIRVLRTDTFGFCEG